MRIAQYKLFFKRLGSLDKQSCLLLLAILLNLFLPYFVANQAHAATLTEASIRLDRMGAGVAANTTTAKILVVAKVATVGTETTVKITWPTTSAFTVDATAANHTVSTTGLPSTYQGESLTAWPGIGTASSVSGGDVTFPSTDLTVGTLYGFFVTGGITNPATGNAGTHLVTITAQASGPTTIDSQTVAVDVVTTNADQVTVTGSINSTFNFAIADAAIALGTLTTSAVAANAMTTGIDVDTNAANGWIAWIRSEGAAATLASATTGDAISSTDTSALVTLSAGTEGYVVDVAVAQGGTSTGTVTIATEYDGNGTTSGGVIATTYEQIAQSTGQAGSDTITLSGIAAISAVNKAAADYTDTWEVVGAGNF